MFYLQICLLYLVLVTMVSSIHHVPTIIRPLQTLLYVLVSRKHLFLLLSCQSLLLFDLNPNLIWSQTFKSFLFWWRITILVVLLLFNFHFWVELCYYVFKFFIISRMLWLFIDNLLYFINLFIFLESFLKLTYLFLFLFYLFLWIIFPKLLRLFLITKLNILHLTFHSLFFTSKLLIFFILL